jgi:hypothetical protein
VSDDTFTLLTVLDISRRLLHTYVSAHGGTFDGPEKNSLRTFLDGARARRASTLGVVGELPVGLGADELRELENALA